MEGVEIIDGEGARVRETERQQSSTDITRANMIA